MPTKLRALKTDEEIKAIPIDQPVMIELPAPPTNAEAGAIDRGAVPAAGASQDHQDPDVKSLQGQLEALQAAQKIKDAENARLANEAREAREAARLALEAQGTAEQQRVTSGLSQAQSDMAAAKQAFKIASEAGDFAAAAEAQEKIGRSSALILHYEQVGAAAGERKPAQQQATPQVAQSTDMIAAMNASPNLLPKEKEWFNAHPEALIDTRMNKRLEVAYDKAIEAGHIRGTPTYFEYIEQEMGYRKPAQQQQRQDEGDDSNQGDASVMAAAPVTRGSQSMSNGNTRPDQVTLSTDERELCANMGISEVEYAKSKVRMQQDKKARPEAYYVQSGR